MSETWTQPFAGTSPISFSVPFSWYLESCLWQGIGRLAWLFILLLRCEVREPWSKAPSVTYLYSGSILPKPWISPSRQEERRGFLLQTGFCAINWDFPLAEMVDAGDCSPKTSMNSGRWWKAQPCLWSCFPLVLCHSKKTAGFPLSTAVAHSEAYLISEENNLFGVLLMIKAFFFSLLFSPLFFLLSFKFEY